MFINRMKKETSNFIFDNIMRTECDLAKVIYHDDKFKYLRNIEFIKLYYKSSTKKLIDQGNPTLSDCTGYDVLGHFLTRLKKETLDYLEWNYHVYTQINLNQMQDLFENILENAYNNNQECRDIYSNYINTLEAKEIYIPQTRTTTLKSNWIGSIGKLQKTAISAQTTNLFGIQPRRKFNNKDNLYMIIDPRAVLAGRNKIGQKNIQESAQHSFKKTAELISDNALLKLARRVGQ